MGGENKKLGGEEYWGGQRREEEADPFFTRPGRYNERTLKRGNWWGKEVSTVEGGATS